MVNVIPFTSATQRPYVAAIGFFDGVHTGHRFLIGQVCAEARRAGLAAMVVTFEEHPRRVLSPDYQPALLTTNEEKVALLQRAGLDACAMLHFSPAMASLTAEAFMRDYLKARLNVEVLIMGYDHHFGSDRLTFDEYVGAGRAVGIRVVKADAYKTADFVVSSSALRRLLAAGDVVQAARGLGRAYELGGTVVEGRHMGRELGFPTANLRPMSPLKLVPAGGVYAVEAVVGAQTYGAMLNIGQRPTLNNGNDTTIEAHLFGFDGQLYGASLTLRFVGRLRDERRFDSLDALRRQLVVDADSAKKILNL